MQHCDHVKAVQTCLTLRVGRKKARLLDEKCLKQDQDNKLSHSSLMAEDLHKTLAQEEDLDEQDLHKDHASPQFQEECQCQEEDLEEEGYLLELL